AFIGIDRGPSGLVPHDPPLQQARVEPSQALRVRRTEHHPPVVVPFRRLFSRSRRSSAHVAITFLFVVSRFSSVIEPFGSGGIVVIARERSVPFSGGTCAFGGALPTPASVRLTLILRHPTADRAVTEGRHMIEILDPAQLARAKVTGAIVADILQELKKRSTVGTNLLDIDQWTKKMILEAGAVSCYVDYAPSFGRGPFGHYICTSVNDAVLHGRPRDYVLADGDLLTLDLAVSKNGIA